MLERSLARPAGAGPGCSSSWRTAAASGAAADRTPFGHGHPYTPSQLSRLLREEMFTPVTAAALYIPPARSRMMLRSAPAWEKLGERWFTRFAGVAMIEAAKQIYARPVAKQKKRRRPVYVPVPQPVATHRTQPMAAAAATLTWHFVWCPREIFSR